MNERKYLKAFIEAGQAENFPNLRKAVKMGRKKCLEEAEKSQLTGRGGAGFMTAAKWKFAWNKPGTILICNCDEGEPGAFKDRYILEEGPFLLLEGMMIAAFALKCSEAYIYIRGEYQEGIKAFKKTLEDNATVLDWFRQEAVPDFELKVVVGGGAYVCGDETSLINSLEGRRPNSRMKPPFPASEGLRGLPTVVNNVETLSNLPLIIRDGGAEFSKLGVPGSRGTKLICLSGSVKNPGLYEIELGKVTLKEIINDLGGGVRNGNIKFVIPGGISTRVLSAAELNIPADYNTLKAMDTSLGTGALIVADETVDALETACTAADFFMHETCGICFPCKEGNRQIHYLLELIKSKKGTEDCLQLINDAAMTAACAARCGLGQACGNLSCSLIDKFRSDFLRYIPESNQQTDVRGEI